MMKRISLSLLLLFLLLETICQAGDWPQFRGPNRDAKSIETALLKEWPAAGPKLLWFYEGLGNGYSTVIVVDGLVYTNGVLPEDSNGTLFAFDLEGNLKWTRDYGPEWSGRHRGSHTPPTFDSGRLYHMSGECVVTCLDAKTGKEIWSVDTVKRFQAVNRKWGVSEAPLIDGENVICTPGGKDAMMVALDKTTGKTVWTTKGHSELSAYCSAQIINWGSKRLVLTMVAEYIVFVDAQSGQVLLRIPHVAKYDINAVSPVFKDGLLYVTNGYGTKYGGIMYEIAPDLSGHTLKWRERKLDCHHGGVILLDGHIYGAGSKGWLCLELTTGKVKYNAKGVGKGCITFADGMFYCYGEKKGEFALVKATPAAYEQISSFRIEKGTAEHWSHPVISNRRLYLRHGNALMVYDIAAK